MSKKESIIVTERRKTSGLTLESMTTSCIHSEARSRCCSETVSSEKAALLDTAAAQLDFAANGAF